MSLSGFWMVKYASALNCFHFPDSPAAPRFPFLLGDYSISPISLEFKPRYQPQQTKNTHSTFWRGASALSYSCQCKWTLYSTSINQFISREIKPQPTPSLQFSTLPFSTTDSYNHVFIARAARHEESKRLIWKLWEEVVPTCATKSTSKF